MHLPIDIAAVHLDAVGGIAGDMFVASLCDALPDLIPAMHSAIDQVRPPGTEVSLTQYSDGILAGSKFDVALQDAKNIEHGHAQERSHKHAEKHHDENHHAHRHWSDIRSMLEASQLPDTTRTIAIAIFALLAEAEATVHGIDVEHVAFHEVGAWDSIVDIVAAGSIIAQLEDCAWSMGPLPIGRGLVKSAHGILPVPAPATVKLLRGFTTIDDGENGERITPTGAAILAYLQPSQTARGTPLTLASSGTGHGTRRLEQRSNVLRSLVFEKSLPSQTSDRIEVLRCEIDDQSGEDLATALEHLRGKDGVLDVCQWPVMGKKGRVGMTIQVLASHGHGDAIVSSILDETTTLGVRRQTVDRDILDRHQQNIDGVRVKVARRPSGWTAKAEADDVRGTASAGARQIARNEAEVAALRKAQPDET